MRFKPYVSRIVQRTTPFIGLRGSLAEDQTARVLHVLLATLAVWLAAGWVVTIPFAPQSFPRYFNPLVQEASYVIALVLLRLGHFRRASLAYLAGTWIWATLICFSAGFKEGGGALLYVSLPASAAWLLGYGAAIRTAGACLLSAFVFAVLEMTHVSVPFQRTTPLGIWFVIVQAVVINAIPLGQIIGRLQETLKELTADLIERSRTEEKLRESEERLRFAQQAASIGTFDWDIETGVSRWTPELEAIYGFPGGGFPGTHSAWQDLVHPDDRALSVQKEKEAFETGMPVEAEWRTILLDGRVRWIFGRWQVFKNAAGKPLRMMGVNMDVTDRKNIEDALRKNEERLRLAIKATNDAVWDLDLKAGTVSWNDTYSTLYGRPETADSWQFWIDRIHPEDRVRTVDGFRAALNCGASSWSSEYRLRRADGRWAYICDRAYIARDASGNVWRVIGAMQDLTESKRAQEIENQLASDLAASRDDIRALAASLIRAQEDERRRVSRELHDQICHQLGYLASDIGNLADSPSAPENLRAHLTAIRARVVKTSQETHHIAYQMQTAILKDLGLVGSLKALYRQFSDQYPNIAVDFKNSGPPTSIPSEMATCLYRVAQEGLQNVAKHSGAKNVSLNLGFEKGAVVLTIHDDGAGFEPKAVKGHGGIGLISMKERAHLVMGELTITAQPGHGTQITLEIPLQADNP